MLGFICTLIIFASIGILITLYYEVYKPHWDRKKYKKFASPEEIDALLIEADIIDKAKGSENLN
ncbi:MAG: hypothetical protein ACK5XN_15665 [Bacteroidota bacterium]|jgi:hypothetical protein